MLAFIAVLREVEVVLDGVGFVGSELDRHVKFTPSFLLDAEWGLLEDYSLKYHRVSKGPNHRQREPRMRRSCITIKPRRRPIGTQSYLE